MLTLKVYEPRLEAEWNAVAAASPAGTFLLDRRYMDYHKDRFEDRSLMFFDGEKAVGALAACLEGDVVWCHGGLTYGPLLTIPSASHGTVHECLELAIGHYRLGGARAMIYKPIPYIYMSGCHDDDLYEMFRRGATLKYRSLSTAVWLPAPLAMRQLRRRCVQKAKKAGLEIRTDGNVDEFMGILADVLGSRHGVKPVHSAAEVKLLMDRFPDNIRLYTVHKEGTMLGGAWVFVTRRVAHVQYIAANEEGRRCGALDLLFNRFVEGEFEGKEWLDFGISTEQGGSVLNEGLLWQKEGFGGRGVCYDQYELKL